jgi:hypothetical protein
MKLFCSPVGDGHKGSPNHGDHHPRKTQITHEHTSMDQSGTKRMQGPWPTTPQQPLKPQHRGRSLARPISALLEGLDPLEQSSASLEGLGTPRVNIKPRLARGRPSTGGVPPIRSTRQKH